MIWQNWLGVAYGIVALACWRPIARRMWAKDLAGDVEPGWADVFATLCSALGVAALWPIAGAYWAGGAIVDHATPTEFMARVVGERKADRVARMAPVVERWEREA